MCTEDPTGKMKKVHEEGAKMKEQPTENLGAKGPAGRKQKTKSLPERRKFSAVEEEIFNLVAAARFNALYKRTPDQFDDNPFIRRINKPR